MEPATFTRLREWANSHGGVIHSSLSFASVANGTSVLATSPIDSNTKLLSCPFSLAITPEASLEGIYCFLGSLQPHDWRVYLRDWSERMLICSYIVSHWVAMDLGQTASSVGLQHLPYLDTLPPFDLLCTAVTFNLEEMELVKGTNLHGATVSRHAELVAEHERCRELFGRANVPLYDLFSAKRYLTASIYLSSRAFPSSVCSANPSLISPADSPAHPILLPILDCLNHGRGTPVTWLVDSAPEDAGLSISIVCGRDLSPQSEVLNNYGAKPNSELILGYGFALENNPDDTILMQLGGSGRKWVIGRPGSTGTEAALEGMFEEATQKSLGQWKEQMAGNDDDEMSEGYEEDMLLMRRDTAVLLLEATQKQVGALPQLLSVNPNASAIRGSVWEMTSWYVEGQRSILLGVLKFLQNMQHELEAQMDELGVDYASGGDDEDEPS